MNVQQHGSEMFFTAGEGAGRCSAKPGHGYHSRLAIAHVTVAFFSQYLGVEMEGAAFALAYVIALAGRYVLGLWLVAQNVSRWLPIGRIDGERRVRIDVTDVQHARVAGVRRLRRSRSL